MKVLNYTIIKLTLCLIIGISLNHWLKLRLEFTFLVFLTLLFLTVITYIIALRQFKKTVWFGILAYLTTISLGSLCYTSHDELNFKNHYSQLLVDADNEDIALKFKIRARLKSSPYHDKYVVSLIAFNHISASGKLLLNVSKDSCRSPLQVDDIMVSYTIVSDLQKPLNPNQFDYKAYLKKQYIHHQIFAEPSELLMLSTQTHTLLGYAAALRDRINHVLSLHHFKPEELAIINALILGQRQDMSKDIYNSYVDAGAIHILAVSGLHVGIVLLLLNFCLKPVERLNNGRVLKVALILILLWSFAVIAGLSASVTRAVTMFSVVAIAMHWKRPTNIYNTLAISIFILLLFKPMFLFDVGFQMSYLAVLAIVTIQPLLNTLWKPKWFLLNYFWQILSVTIAAQCGVVPISLYYFHQFPGLFFVSNLVIIPFLGLILGFGILVIILALVNCLPTVLAELYGSVINIMNSIVSWISNQEDFILKHISYDIEQVLVCYMFLVAFVMVFKKPNFKTVALFLVSILAMQGVWFLNKWNTNASEFIIFHQSRRSILAHRDHRSLNVFRDSSSIMLANEATITNYNVENHIETVKEDGLESVYHMTHGTLLVVDSIGVYNVKTFRPDYILLRNSPRINLERLIDSIKPRVIIADGSNFKSYLKRWEATCMKRKLPFHQTDKKGAFILKHQLYSDSLNSGLKAK